VFFVQKNQLDAQIILSMFRQPPHVSRVSMAHHLEVQPYVCNSWYLFFFLDNCLLFWLGCSTRPEQQTVNHVRSKRDFRHTGTVRYVYPKSLLWMTSCSAWRLFIYVVCFVRI